MYVYLNRLEAKIITIRPHYRKRSAGYGFVTFATLEDTIKAAKELNKKELDGREVNVEVARPKPIAPKPAATSSTDGTNSETEAASKQQKRRVRKNVSVYPLCFFFFFVVFFTSVGMMTHLPSLLIY